jgi:CHAD domain-containing protein
MPFSRTVRPGVEPAAAEFSYDQVVSAANRIEREVGLESDHPFSHDALMQSNVALTTLHRKGSLPKDDAERVRLYFAQQYVDLQAADPGVRLGLDAEPVHEMRVAVRRLRALLRAARPIFVREWADALRAELGWLGRALGPLRDLDVFSAYLRAETLNESDRAALEPVFPALETDRAAAREEALSVLQSQRYSALFEALASPPQLLAAEVSLDAIAARELKKLRTTVRRAERDGSDEQLHKARIQAKRLRYVAEALGEKRVVRRAKAFQDVVGEHQDAVVAEERLRALAARVPEAALPLGVLIERQRGRRGQARGDAPKSWKRLYRAAASAWA